jgi:hypothetical protein
MRFEVGMRVALGEDAIAECVYVLVDPRDESIRYVGRTSAPHLRATTHACQSSSRGDKAMWTAELLSLGLRPRLEIVETFGINRRIWPRSPCAAEQAWIDRARASGADLLNIRRAV